MNSFSNAVGVSPLTMTGKCVEVSYEGPALTRSMYFSDVVSEPLLSAESELALLEAKFVILSLSLEAILIAKCGESKRCLAD
jgi:hypothetical protein